MHTPLPTTDDFAFSTGDHKKLKAYFDGFYTKDARDSSGLTLVISPDAALRTRLIYALANGWVVRGVGGDLYGGGVSSLEDKTSFEIPPQARMQQLEYEKGKTAERLKTLVRTAPYFIVLDKIQDAETAAYVVRCYECGMRVIAGVEGSTIAKGFEAFSRAPAEHRALKYSLDLIVLATHAKDLRVVRVKSGPLLTAFRTRKPVTDDILNASG